tara:strand:- start:771 stop:1190 length:420 start_codon:yes stop_codon:yes gene_type:complete
MNIDFKDCRKAVNQAKYMATPERKAQALKLLKQLTDSISNLEEVEAKPSKSNPLARKASAGRPRNRNEKLERQQARANVCTTYLKPEVVESYKAPRREVYTLSEGETVEVAMAKLRTKRMQDAEAVAMAEFETDLESPF